MAVGDVVSGASRDLQEDPVLLGDLGLLQGDEAGMRQAVDVGILHGCPVRTGSNGLHDGLPVDDDPLGPQGPGLAGDLPYEPRRHMGDLHAGYDGDVVLSELAGLHQVGHDELHVGHVYVVGDGDDVMSEHHRPPHELGGDELSVAVDRVGVEIGSHWALSQSLR